MNTKVAKKNNKGFTLIELIVVIAIIAVLAAILAPQYLRYVEKSRVTSDESTAKEIKNAVQTSCADSDVFSDVSSGTVVTWKGDNGTILVGSSAGSGTNIASATDTTNQKLAYELGQTIKEVPKMKSKKWQTTSGTYTANQYTVTITVANNSVTLSESKPS